MSNLKTHITPDEMDSMRASVREQQVLAQLAQTEVERQLGMDDPHHSALGIALRRADDWLTNHVNPGYSDGALAWLALWQQIGVAVRALPRDIGE